MSPEQYFALCLRMSLVLYKLLMQRCGVKDLRVHELPPVKKL